MPIEQTKGRDEEFSVPPITVSPITGATGSINWGALNKFNTGSRNAIGDNEADELINFVPQLSAFQQVPGPGPLISTLPSPLIWGYTDILNGNLVTFYLCQNGSIYQVSTGGAQVLVGTGFSTGTNQVDITIWQGTDALICDVVQAKVFDWNGSTLTTIPALTGTPANFIAVFSGRVWLAHGLVITWTAAGTNNSLGGDSGSFVITDSGCANPVLGMINAQGSLYLAGSNWWKTIGNLSDIGTPPVLTFQQPTLQSQVGIYSKWGVVVYGAYIYFANVNGCYQMSGAIPTKISTPMDGFFQQLVFPGTNLSACYTVIYNKQAILWQAKWGGDNNYTAFGFTADGLWFRVVPVTGAGTGILQWLTGAVSSAITNNVPIAYYSDGTNIYNLFGSATASVTSTFNTKIWSFFSNLAFDMFTNVAIQLVVFGNATLALGEVNSSGAISGPLGPPPSAATYSYSPDLGQWINNASVLGNWINNSSVQGTWSGVSSSFYVFQQAVIPFQERNMGLNMTLTGAQGIIQCLVISYRKMSVAKG